MNTAKMNNTEPKTFKFTWHVDVRHEYLEVPAKLIVEEKLTDLVSTHSFTRGDKVFLEGDVDAATLIDCLNDQGHQLVFQEKVVQGESVIRQYQRYNPN